MSNPQYRTRQVMAQIMERLRANDPPAERLTQELRALSPALRAAVLKQFCRNCHVPLDGPDWTGQNYCTSCSPDPKE